jgi:hypothetical protein
MNAARGQQSCIFQVDDLAFPGETVLMTEGEMSLIQINHLTHEGQTYNLRPGELFAVEYPTPTGIVRFHLGFMCMSGRPRPYAAALDAKLKEHKESIPRRRPGVEFNHGFTEAGRQAVLDYLNANQAKFNESVQ